MTARGRGPSDILLADLALHLGTVLWCATAVTTSWITASRVTAACEQIREKVLPALCVTACSLTEGQLEDHASTKRFLEYIDSRPLGFSCRGHTISYHLGMTIVYLTLTGFATVVATMTTVLPIF